MNLSQYTEEIKNQILLKFKNVTLEEVKEGLNKNESFIKFCFENDYSINHVVHELTL